MNKRKKNLKGMVLITVVCLMSLLILSLTCALAIVTSINRKSIKHYTDNQVYSIAKSNLDSFISCLKNPELKSFDPIREKIFGMSAEDTIVVNLNLKIGTKTISEDDDKIILKKDSDGNIYAQAEGNFQGNYATVSRELIAEKVLVSESGSSNSGGNQTTTAKYSGTDIVLVFDTSQSMKQDDTNAVRDASIKFMDQIHEKKADKSVRIGAVSFSEEAGFYIAVWGGSAGNILIPLTDKFTSPKDYYGEPTTGIQKEIYDGLFATGFGGTHIASGMVKACEYLKPKANEGKRKKIIIMFGDGGPTYGYKILHKGTSATDLYKFGNKIGNGKDTTQNVIDSSKASAENAKLLGIKVFTIGFGVGKDTKAINTLKSMASKDDNDNPLYFSSNKNEAALQSVMDQIMEEVYEEIVTEEEETTTQETYVDVFDGGNYIIS